MRFSVLCVSLVLLGALAWQARGQNDEPEITSALLEVSIRTQHLTFVRILYIVPFVFGSLAVDDV